MGAPNPDRIEQIASAIVQLMDASWKNKHDDSEVEEVVNSLVGVCYDSDDAELVLIDIKESLRY